jgi:pimeloyl-ACP methyl ester carboxylesterase
VLEGLDVAAAVEFAKARGFERPWLVGWSFGTELAIKFGPDHDIAGAILLSPPLHRATEADLRRWNDFQRPLIALVPELDDYLVPEAAKERFGVVEHAQVIGFDGEKHLWVGEKATLKVLNAICEVVLPGSTPLPEVF